MTLAVFHLIGIVINLIKYDNNIYLKHGCHRERGILLTFQRDTVGCYKSLTFILKFTNVLIVSRRKSAHPLFATSLSR